MGKGTEGERKGERWGEKDKGKGTDVVTGTGRKSYGWGAFDAWTVGLFGTVCGPCFRADVLTVSGSMEGEIPTKGGVQILWEIRPLFNIS